MTKATTPFGKRLRAIRKQKGLSLKQLEDLSLVPFNRISNYEQGKYEPSLTSLIALAAALGVTLEYLTARTNTNTRSST